MDMWAQVHLSGHWWVLLASSRRRPCQALVYNAIQFSEEKEHRLGKPKIQALVPWFTGFDKMPFF